MITECACDTRQGNSVTWPVVDRSQLRSNRHQRVHTGYLQDAQRMRTGQTHENRTDRIPTHELRSSTIHIYPMASVRIFEQVQNLPTDRTG